MLTSNLRKNDFCESLKFTASSYSVKVIALSSGNIYILHHDYHHLFKVLFSLNLEFSWEIKKKQNLKNFNYQKNQKELRLCMNKFTT